MNILWKWKKSQNFSLCACTVHHSWQKFVQKLNFLKFFLAFHNPHTSDYMHAKFRQNRTIFNFWGAQCPELSENQKISDFDEIWRAYSLKYVDCEKQKMFWKKLFFGQIFVINGALCAYTTWNFETFFTFTKHSYVRNLKKISDATGYVHFAW